MTHRSHPGRPASVEPLQARRLLASAGQLLAYDFNAAAAWPSVTSVNSAGVGATAGQAAVGTIDVEGGTTPTGAAQLTVGTVPASGAWSSELSSGRLALANTETNLGKLTIAFNLSASQARAVTVRVYSHDAAGQVTGALEGEVLPPVADAYQRYALDLSTMKPAGGTFDPVAASVSFGFSVGSVSGWSAASARTVRVDNLSYSKPAYYVKPAASGGSNQADGRTEATAFATPAKAVSVARAGDIIDVMNGTYTITANSTGAIDFSVPGTPAAWITLKNYPGHTPQINNEWWTAINVGNGTAGTRATTAAVAYIEVRGLHVRGNADYANTAYPSALGQTDPRTNNNGISVDGRYETNHPHDIRFADNFVEYCSGAGIGAGEADRIQIENNVVQNTSWWTKYGTSGISILSAYSFDATSNTYTRVVRNNQVSGNQTFVKWAAIDKFSDGNGIIIDYNRRTTDLPNGVVVNRTLVINNVSFNNGGGGVHVYKADHVDVVNNTAYLNSASPELEYPQIDANSANDVRFYGNIAVAPVANTAAGQRAEPVNGNYNSTNVVYNNNLYFGGNTAPVMGSGDQKADPKFVFASIDPAVADFRLQAASPAVDKGSTNALVPVRDVLNRPRVGVADVGAYEYDAPPTLSTVVSRKTHGAAGTFDLALATSGTATIEPRQGGGSTLVFAFSEPVLAADGTLDASEFGLTNAAFASASLDGSTLTLNLSGVANATYTTVVLRGLVDAGGNALAGDADLTVGHLYGDVNRTGSVSVSDQQAVKNNLLAPLTALNFLSDVNLSGAVSVSDQQAVKNYLLTTIA